MKRERVLTLVIDDKGDSWIEIPHIFVDFVDGSPVSNTIEYLEKGQRHVGLEDFSQKVFFPDPLPEPKFGKIYDDEGLALPASLCEQYVNFRGVDLNALYDVDGRFAHLKPNDVAVVRFRNKDDRFIQITHRYKLSGEDILRDQPQLSWQVSQQIGRAPTSDDMIDVFEVRNCYKHQWEGRV